MHETRGVEADERRIARNQGGSGSGRVAERVEARRRDPRRVDVDGQSHALRRQRQNRSRSGGARRVKGDAPPAPLTLAVISLSPAIVPRVHAAVACPFDSVVAMRGLVEPLPPVTANATDAPATARPDASVTVTTSPPGIVAPTSAVRLRSVAAARCAGGPLDGDVESPPQANATEAAAINTSFRAICTINEFIGWTGTRLARTPPRPLPRRTGNPRPGQTWANAPESPGRRTRARQCEESNRGSAPCSSRSLRRRG